MTFTAMRPDVGLANGLEVSLWRVSQASWLISALSVVFRAWYGIVGAEEVGVADEEALLVVVGVDEPTGDAIGVVATDFAGVGVEHIDAVDLDLDLILLRVEDINVRLAEDDEEVAFPGVLEVVGHVEVGVHARLEDWDATQLIELRGMGFIVERTGDQHVEVGICGLARGLYEIGTGDGTEFRANEDAGALFGCRSRRRLRRRFLRHRPDRRARV